MERYSKIEEMEEEDGDAGVDEGEAGSKPLTGFRGATCFDEMLGPSSLFNLEQMCSILGKEKRASGTRVHCRPPHWQRPAWQGAPWRAKGAVAGCHRLSGVEGAHEGGGAQCLIVLWRLGPVNSIWKHEMSLVARLRGLYALIRIAGQTSWRFSRHAPTGARSPVKLDWGS